MIITHQQKVPINIVWFKRDLRVQDHAALAAAFQQGLVLPLFCWEPTVWQNTTDAQTDYAKQHQQFILECLVSLTQALKALGLVLLQSPFGMVETLNLLQQHYQITQIFSHEETGNGASFTVDKTVAVWCKHHQVVWQEFAQNGVVRRLKNRNHWNAHWEQRMTAPQVKLPMNIKAAPITLKLQALFAQNKIVQAVGEDKPRRQKGARENALSLFESFLDDRAAKFRGGISSPLTAVTAGSRLSPYLAYGCLSMREVVQATRERREWAMQVPHMFSKSLNAGLIGFESRLHWHCHFMQKLESEPEMEFENLHHAHDGMRDETLSTTEAQQRLSAWRKGETGWPLVDACMAMLRATGWINFRMRAMLMSTASYLYWLHWRQTGLHLAREFLDFEPGIHWSQVQMQSGTTGINTLRIYSPIKQAQDQDPTGAFVRHWLPALKRVPDAWIFEPHLMPPSFQLQYGCILEKDYPLPLVDITVAMREARAKIKQARHQAGAYDETQAIIKKHASRKGMMGSQRDEKGRELVKQKGSKKSPKKPSKSQLDLDNARSAQQELFE